MAVVIASVIMLSHSHLVQDEGSSEVAFAGPAPAVKNTGDRVRVARLPRAVRRPMSSLAKDKGPASDLQVDVEPETDVRRPGARNGTGEAVAPARRGEGLVNQL